MNKYRAKKVVIDGIRFASLKEGRRYNELKLLVKAEEIFDLTLQPKYTIKHNNIKICTYRADFTYTDVRGVETIEDVKGFKTPVYRLKKKMMKAFYGIDILET